MATKAVFEADFDSFYAAVDTADAKLKAFDSQTATVSKSLTDMVNAFSPVEAIREATLMTEAIERIGGASMLTNDQLKQVEATLTTAMDRAAKFGMDVPESMSKLADEVGNLRGSWNNFLTSFNVESAIKHPIETATDALTAFANSIGPAGQEALAASGLVAALSVEAYKLASNAAEVGERFGDMSEKTGLSVSQLSRYSNALQVAGGDLGTVTNALYTFERGAATGSKTFEEGLKAIGLSLSEVRDMNPDQYLDALAQGFDSLQDPTTRAATAQALFGRQGRELLPILNDVAQGLKRTSDIQPFTAEQAAAAKEFEMNVRSLETHVESFALTIGNQLIPKINATFDELKNLEPAWDTLNGWLTTVSNSLDYLATGRWPETTKAVETHQKAVWELSLTDQEYADLVKQITEDQKTQNDVWKESQTFMANAAKLHKEQEDAARKYAEALSALMTVTQGYKGALNEMSGADVEAIKFYLQAGVSQKDLAEAYGYTAQQIKAVSLALKEENEARKLEKEQADAASKLWTEYYKQLDSLDNSSTQNRIANIWAAAQAKYEALDREKKYSQSAADAVTATAQLETDKVVQQTLEKDKTSHAYYEKQAADAQQSYQFALEHWDQFSQKQLDNLQRNAQAADTALANWQQTADAVAANTTDAAGGAANALEQMGKAAVNAAAAVQQLSSASWKNPQGETVSWDWIMHRAPGLASGGPVAAGSPYLVGERGPELFVPATSGTIVPGGGAGGTTVSNTFHLVDTESNLARRVADIVMQSVRNGVRLNAF